MVHNQASHALLGTTVNDPRLRLVDAEPEALREVRLRGLKRGVNLYPIVAADGDIVGISGVIHPRISTPLG